MRLAGRGKMRPDEQKRRYETALMVLEDGLKQNYYQFVITDNIDQSAKIIDAIIAEKANPHQGRAPGLIQQLQENIKQKIESMVGY